MKITVFFLIALSIVCLPAKAQNSDAAKPSDVVFNRVRFFPATGHEKDMMGGRFLGSNVSKKDGFELLAEIKTVPAAGQWTELTFPNTKAYRWIQYAAPPGSYGQVAKLIFYSGDHQLTGDPVGSFPLGAERVTLDGKEPTANVFFLGLKPDDQTIGLDLGNAATNPSPVLDPGTGEYKDSVTVTINRKGSGGTIRYTTDGTKPAADTGQVYSAPIKIDKTTTICAALFEDGKAPSRPVDATYMIGAAIPTGTVHVGNSLSEITASYPRQSYTAGYKDDRHALFISGSMTIKLWNAAQEMIGLGISADKLHWSNDYGKTLSPNSPVTLENGKEAWYKLWPGTTRIDDFTLQPRDFNIAEEADYDNRFLNWVFQVAPDVQPWLYIEWVEKDRKRPTDLGHEPTTEMKTVFPAETWEESMAAMVLYGEDLKREVDKTYKGTKPIRIIPTALAMGWLHHMVENGEVPGVDKDDFYQAFFKDQVHVNPEGAFLVDCTWYAAFHGESPEDKLLPVQTDLTHEQAKIMQCLAWNVVKNYPASSYYEEGPTPVGAPVFSPVAAPIKDITPVTLSSSTPGAWFRYTLDGTTPSRTNGYIYCGVISVRPGMKVKSIAYQSGMADSAIVEATYPDSAQAPSDKH